MQGSKLFQKITRGLFLFLLIPFSPSFSETLTPAQSLQSLLSNLQSLHAHFHEESDGRTADGEVWIQKPGEFFWKTLSPTQETFLSDGISLYHYDPDLLQATETPLSSALEQTPLLLLSGKITDISQSYTVESVGDGAFRLTPIQSDASSGELIQSMELRFQSEKISSFSLKSQLGQKTAVTFSKVEWNPSIDPSTFRFVLPAGADLFEQ